MRNRHARVNVTRFALAMFPSPRHPRLPRTISPGPRAALQHEYGRNSKSARTTGEFNTPEDIAQVVLRSTGQQRVTLGDLAEIRPGFEKKNSVVLQNGVPGIAIGVRPEAGTNILEMTNLTEEKYLWLNENKLNQEGLYLDWVYDQRFYINGAIDQIKQAIVICIKNID